MVALPALEVLRAHGRALGVHGSGGFQALEAGGHELDLAAHGLQAFAVRLVPRRRAPVGRVLRAILGEPAQRWLGPVFLGRHGNDVVALVGELVPGHGLGHVGGVEVVLHPVELGLAAHGERAPHSKTLRQPLEDRVVGLGVPQRLDALLLEHNDSVVGEQIRIRDVARAVGSLADVKALEVGAGRQDDVGELGLPFEPNGLVYHERDFALPVRGHVAVGLGHGAEERSAVAVVHLHVRITLGRVGVLLELALDVGAAEALAPPFQVLVTHGFGDAQARHRLAFGGVVRVGDGAAVGEHTVDEAKTGGRVGRVSGDAALCVTREHEAAIEGRAAGGAPDVAARLA